MPKIGLDYDDVVETKKPILSELEIGIGEIFSYDNSIWVRTNRYKAHSINEGHSCYFGWVGEKEYKQEWDKFLREAVKIDNKKIAEELKKLI